MAVKKLTIREEFIRLDSALKLAGFVSTGGQAKLFIKDGQVLVNGQVCTMRGKKLYKGDSACLGDDKLIIENAG